MRTYILLLVLMLWSSPSFLAPNFIVNGGADKPVGFMLQPLVYQGDGLSPAVAIEEILVARLSQSGLFYLPWQQSPNKNWRANYWRLVGVRYLISGRIEETNQAIHLHLTITDTSGDTPMTVWVELNAEVWQQATQVFARQLFYSLFYATYTDDVKSQYLEDIKPEESRYWVSLVQTIKAHWQNRVSQGECRVSVSQLPGGQVQSYVIEEPCDSELVPEIQVLFEQLNQLPYGGLGSPFSRVFTVTFVARG